MKSHLNIKGRNCWGTARERERIRARFEIRERVLNNINEPTTDDASNSPSEAEAVDLDSIRPFLRSVAENSPCVFSLSTLSKNVSLVANPFSSEWMSEYKITTICTSRYGAEHAKRVLAFRRARKSCTIMEYASLLGNHRIVAALLKGGIDPTISGTFPEATADCLHVSASVSARVLRRFFDFFPPSLSAYIVKRVVDMRLQGFIEGSCNQICFGEPCRHMFCEEILWQDLMEHVDERVTGDVVLCPYCDAQAPSSNQQDEWSLEASGSSPSERRETSLAKYLALPIDTDQVRSGPRKASKKEQLAFTWPQAVSQSLGYSQDVRRDKFFSCVEQGTYHHLRGCLMLGMDVNAVNEYGQTGLYIAAWRGHKKEVELLLFFGADPDVMAHGHSTAASAARLRNQVSILEILPFSKVRRAGPSFPTHAELSISESTMQLLIPIDSNHPGAGACLIDGAFSDTFLTSLVQLWKTLPASLSDRKKQKNVEQCSDRHYFCDAESLVTSILETSIQQNFHKPVTVFPHMRFLNYRHEGSELAPHVDLCRVDTDSGQRSTHTFILYLHSCEEGGETVLLKELTSFDGTMAIVKPKYGRLLLFPHLCPHMGAPVVHVPKLLLRGEVHLN